MESGNVILDKSFRFALRIIEFAAVLEAGHKFVIAKQILRSGTSIGANIRESQSAESKADFIHKLKIAEKELNETEYWLLLCKYSNNYPDPDNLLKDISEMKKILGTIISTSKKQNK